MKKAISLFLVLSVLSLATCAMAAPTVDNGGVSNGSVSYGRTTTFFTGDVTGAGRTTPMPGFRPGEQIVFTAKTLTPGAQLTVISYKCENLSSGITLSDSNVQYINQYTISGNQEVRYTIRNTGAGIYCLKMNDAAYEDVATFYYKVGDVSTEMIPSDGTPYTKVDYHDGTYSIGFIGKATISGSTNVALGDIVSGVGFTFTAPTTGTDVNSNVNGATRTIAASDIDTYFNDLIDSGDIELNGSYSVIYGMTIFHVPSVYKDSITATAVVN